MQKDSGKIGNETFEASAGVRQGGSLSCPLFTFYIDSTIDAINATGPDDWLEFLHCLLLVDDTVVFASTRERLILKLRSLKQSSDLLDMALHPTKSKFLLINDNCTEDIVIDNTTISHTDCYVYLGTPILNATVTRQVQEHLQLKSAHMLKFTSFLVKNNDAPFRIKETVLHMQSTQAYSIAVRPGLQITLSALRHYT